MKPIKNMILFLLLTAVNNIGICILAKQYGGLFVMLLVAIPIMTICYAIIYSTVHGFSFTYPLLAAVISFPALFAVLGFSLKISGFGVAVLFILALFGCAIGQIFYSTTNAISRVPNKKRKKH